MESKILWILGLSICREDRVIIVDAVLCTVLKQAVSEARPGSEFTEECALTKVDTAALASVELFVFVGEDGGTAANPSRGP